MITLIISTHVHRNGRAWKVLPFSLVLQCDTGAVVVVVDDDVIVVAPTTNGGSVHAAAAAAADDDDDDDDDVSMSYPKHRCIGIFLLKFVSEPIEYLYVK